MARFEKHQYKWKCEYYAATHAHNGTRRVINGFFEGAGEDIVARCQLELNYKLKKPWIWYGVGITITTPLGQKTERVIEPRCDGYGVVLVEG